MIPPLLPRFALFCLFGLLGGCTLLLPEKTPQRTFTLPTPTLAPSELGKLDLILRIDTPQASSPLNGARIVVLTRQHELSVYAGARWGDRAPILLRNHLIEAFRQDGRLTAVLSDDSPARSDLTLISHLSAFHSVYPPARRGANPEAVIRLDVQLIGHGSRDILASHRFESRLASDGEQIEAVIEALGRAGDQLSRELVAWTLTQLDSHLPKP